MKKKYQYTIAIILLILALGIGVTLGAVFFIIQETPDISNYKGARQTTRIYSAGGEELARFFTEDRVYVPVERIPSDLKNAIIAIEDTNFYSHSGIDFWGIARAALANIREGRAAQGGSTLTQQLARTALLGHEKTFYRKIQEAYLAIQFEHLYTKPEVLEMYLNEIFFGHSAHGVQAASLLYFDKNVWELTLSEAALIAGLPPAPNDYSPLRYPAAALRRRNIVLRRMKNLEFITEEEYEQAINEDISFSDSIQEEENTIIYFENFIRRELRKKLAGDEEQDITELIYGGGLQVYTTLDLEMQKEAETAYNNALDENEGFIPTIQRADSEDILQPQAAIISLETETGAIRAMVGGRGNDHFNRAIQAKRQPGSAFKPFVYTTAFEKGYNPGSIINDLPVLLETPTGQQYSPRNYDNTYHGFITARKGLAESINVAAVKLADQLGVTSVIDRSSDMGISTFTRQDYSDGRFSVALGGLHEGVIPLEMASAYSIYANEGIKTEPYAIEKILDSRGNVIYEASPTKEIILDETTSYLMNDILQSVVTEGTGWRIANSIDHPVAGKTGTTNNNTDAWFVGYTPELVTAVWIGEDRSIPMKPEYGYNQTIESREAVMLWRDYMAQVLENRPRRDFNRPDSIVSQEICPINGLLPNNNTLQTVTEIFAEGTEPTTRSNFYEPLETVRVDSTTGKLATRNCPNEDVVERHYLQNSGIRINYSSQPLQIQFSYNNPDSDFSGVYQIPPYHPVQKMDADSGLPMTTITGEPVYETKPEATCDRHDFFAPRPDEPEPVTPHPEPETDTEPETIPEDEEFEEDEDDEERTIIQDIWDFLNTKQDYD